MGVPVDTRVVEYAYVVFERVVPNQLVTSDEVGEDGNPVAVNKYRHRVQLQYELLDADKVLIDNTAIDHFTELTDNMESRETYNAKIGASMDDWMDEDKEKLSGYTS